MFNNQWRILLAAGLSVSLSLGAAAAELEGESLLTPNQQRRIAQVNRDLPTDLKDQPGDSRRVTELRTGLREALAAYKQAVAKFGSPTPESRAAGHAVGDAQQALHRQSIQEEAVPALSQVPPQ